MMRIRRFLITLPLLVSLCSSFYSAQGGGQQLAPRRVLIRAGRLLDVRAGRTLTDQAILIEGDRIIEVGPASQIAGRAAGAAVIDLSNATVLPGLTDCHTHLTGNPDQVGYSSLGISIPRATLYGARNARVTLDAGFTTVRNVGAPGYTDV